MQKQKQKEKTQMKKTSIVKINEKPEIRHIADLDYSSNNGSAMMVQVSHNKKQVNGITIYNNRKHGNNVLRDSH